MAMFNRGVAMARVSPTDPEQKVHGYGLFWLAISLLVLLHSCAPAAQPPWIRDLDAGKKAAQSSGKDLMIVFTGHGWCLNCDILDKEVFQQALYIEQASKTHEFVELDLVFGETPEAKSRERRYRELQSKYLIRGVPTVVLADADGRPYAYMTGHAPGNGPVTALAMMRLAHLAKQQRDRSFQTATAANGPERARYLHEGVNAVGWLLGSLAERGDDPVLVFYRDQTAEIERLDAAGKLRTKYAARRIKRDEWLAQESVFARLKAFDETRDFRGAIAFIGDAIPKIEDKETLRRLEHARQVYLEWDQQYDAALKNVQRLLESPDLRSEDREWVLDRESFNLFNLLRIDEALSHCDRRIADARDNPTKRRRLLWWKAQMIMGRDRPEQAIAAGREFRDVESRGTERWQTATSLLARELRKARQHKEALTLVNEVLEIDKSAWSMLDAAESYLALGEKEKADALIRQAEAAAEPFKKSERQSEKDIAARIQKRIETLRGQMAAIR
jgi:thioredoxin-related protein